VSSYAAAQGPHLATGGLLTQQQLRRVVEWVGRRVVSGQGARAAAGSSSSNGGSGSSSSSSSKRGVRTEEKQQEQEEGAQPAAAGCYSESMAVFVVHWAALALVAASVMHVQVATRFLSASCPQLYWFTAHLLLRGRGCDGCRSSSGSGSSSAAAAGGRAAVALLVWGYCWGFMALGALLFSNFYPWT